MTDALRVPSPASSTAHDDRYRAFLETVSNLRGSLHRYCTHLTGSPLDGEDVMQQALLDAWRRLDTLDSAPALRTWLFRIAHSRAIDFLRRNKLRPAVEAAAADEEAVDAVLPDGPGMAHALERLVLRLPPKERACVLLKDVFDYSLAEIAELTGSSANSVKAALFRARTRLATPAVADRAPAIDSDPRRTALLQLYVDRFNRQDWDGVRELTSADARLQVYDRFEGLLAQSPYFSRYQQWLPWTAALERIAGEEVVAFFRLVEGKWGLAGLVRVDVGDGKVVGIRDYRHCPWVAQTAAAWLAGRRGDAPPDLQPLRSVPVRVPATNFRIRVGA